MGIIPRHESLQRLDVTHQIADGDPPRTRLSPTEADGHARSGNRIATGHENRMSGVDGD